MLWEFVFCWSLQASGTWTGISFSKLKKFSSMNLLKMSSMLSWWCLFSFYAHNQKLMSTHGVPVLFMESQCCSWCPIFCSYFFYNCLYWVIQFFCLVFHSQFCFPTQSILLERFSNEVFIGTKFFVSNIISVWVFFSNSVTIFISWIDYILFICFAFMEYIHALFELFEYAYNNYFEFFFLAFEVISLEGYQWSVEQAYCLSVSVVSV